MATKFALGLLGCMIIFATKNACADQATYGRCSPSIGTMNGSAKVVVQCANESSSAQEAYLVATHPTKLEVTDAHFTTWLEDHSEPFLSLVFKNSSEIPAINVRVDVLRTDTGSRFDQLKPYQIERSEIYKMIDSLVVTVGANGESTLPIVSLKDLENLVQPDVPRDFCAYDASLKVGESPEENQARDEEDRRRFMSLVVAASTDQPLPPTLGARFLQRPVLMRFTFTTIFRQHVTDYLWVFVYYAQKGATRTLWYPSKQALAPLTCVGDDTWRVIVK